MLFTKDDVELVKGLLTIKTHIHYRSMENERVKQIWFFLVELTQENTENVLTKSFYQKILCDSRICDFIFDNDILDLRMFDKSEKKAILIESPIAEKIWDSGKLDPCDFKSYDFVSLLEKSPIRKKIYESEILKSYLKSIGEENIFDGEIIRKLLVKSSFAEDMFKADIFDFDLFEKSGAPYNRRIFCVEILQKSPIAGMIWDSGKLDKYIDFMFNKDANYNTWMHGTPQTWWFKRTNIGEKIFRSGKIDKYLQNMSEKDIRRLLLETSFGKEAWHSGKLDISKLPKKAIDYFTKKFSD